MFEKTHSRCPVANIVRVDLVLVIQFICFVLRIVFLLECSYKILDSKNMLEN